MGTPESPLKATSQSAFCFLPITCFPLVGFWAQVPIKCLRFAIFNCSKKLQNSFEIGLKKCGVFIQKSLLKQKYFEINNSQFCSLYVELHVAIVQI